MRGTIVLIMWVLLASVAGCANPWLPPGETVATSEGRLENKPSRLVTGNYCGFGTRSGDLSLPPVDSLDAACLDHDVCFTSGGDRCACNRTLATAAKAVIADRKAPRRMHRKAGLVLSYLAATWPMCQVFPEGVLPPRKKDILDTLYRPEGQGE
jgi:hypothetical protein